MKISVFDGSVEFARGTVRRTVPRSEFLASPLGHNAKVKLVSEEWWHVTIAPEPGISANLLFKGDRLHQVFLLFKMPSDESDKWTTELELQRKTLHDQWLHAELGMPPYEYRWGNVFSEFDAKGCVSEIIITYAT